MSFTLKCDNCGKTKSFPCADLDWEILDSHERELGTETNYEAVFKTSCDDSWEESEFDDENISEQEECDDITVTFTCNVYGDDMASNDCKASGAKVIESSCSPV